MPTQNRGQLTQRIKDKSKELLGYEISMRELRLMAYVHYIMANSRHTERSAINDEEREIFEQWQDKGFCDRNANFSLTVTHKFWVALSEIIWLGYVDLIE